ncbi:erv26 super protein [Coemansia sp. RSA 376]|nr:erv26 super protein [Coemansia sp. S680]KAJ2046330.1 erv26 super protein [Coemansia sp. S16]KAJ2093972.1 erv26 super protein [Coemansia sp. S142-1]KAJ2112092.1 erv26 super protein [Coemansia sp. RSA 922]KAJ2245488.1 erv26 super protein [Coemansia sp. RSA 455]KAJ2261725.1 erv26 super protein [Coemansia sp. RSA 376]
MAVFLNALATLGWVLGAAFVVFSIGCGLYVISEWVEEYPRQTRKLIQFSVWTIDIVHVLAALDGVSLWRAVASMCVNHVYTLNLETFPLVQTTRPAFLGSCALAVGNHFMWFFYFIQNLEHPFGHVCALMFFCVWMVPLALFVSLTPMDVTLPRAHDSGDHKRMRQNMFKTLFAKFRQPDDSRTRQQSLHAE